MRPVTTINHLKRFSAAFAVMAGSILLILFLDGVQTIFLPPAAVIIMALVVSGYVGGRTAGLAANGLALLFLALFLGRPYTHEDIARLVLIAIGGPPIVLLIADLRRAADQGAALKAARQVLETEVSQRRQAEADLRALAQQLEERVHERTAELEEANHRIGGLAAQLEERAEVLEKANRDLESFSYSVSHDLRAPLRTVVSFARILQEDEEARLTEEGRESLQRIRRAGTRMSELIDDLLRLSRVARAAVRPNEVDFTTFAREIAEETARRKPRPEAEIIVHEGMRASADAKLLEIAVENLVENAWKFTSQVPRPKIEIGRTDHEGETAFFVRDNGVGFDPEHQDLLFQPFQRLHSEREFEGSGIGLAIVHRVVESHGGRMWAESSPGKGATFFFTLPDPD
jgi:signal transduction histidine kinase